LAEREGFIFLYISITYNIHTFFYTFKGKKVTSSDDLYRDVRLCNRRIARVIYHK